MPGLNVADGFLASKRIFAMPPKRSGGLHALARWAVAHGRRGAGARKPPRPVKTHSRDSSGEDEETGNNEKIYAARVLRNLLLSKFASGLLPATDVCAICYWVNKMQIEGFGDLALNPSSMSFSANAGRKLARTTELVAMQRSQYLVKVPASVDGKRVWTDVSMNLIHELAATAYERRGQRMVEVAQGLTVAKYQQHPVVLENAQHGAPVLPYGHFVDGAQYKGKGVGTVDSVIVYYINYFGLQGRKALATLRKEALCGESCGCTCKGRCTIQAVEAAIVWSAACAASGVHPTERHDGLGFVELHRLQKAGQPLTNNCAKFIMLEYRADWDQYSSIGLPRPRQHRFCFKCTCSAEQAYAFDHRHEWPQRNHDSFMHDMAQCVLRLKLR